MRCPPPCQLFRDGEAKTGQRRSDIPVRNSDDRAMFIRMLGARQTMDIAIDNPAAPRSRKSMKAQEAINPLDTIVTAGFLYRVPK